MSVVRLAKTTLIAALLAGTATIAARASGPDSLPPLDVVLAPHADGGKVDRMGVTLRIGKPEVKAGEALLRMPLTLVSTPTARYDTAAITAQDDKGSLILTAVEEEPTPTGVYRQWTVDRDTVGDVTVRYAGPPRSVNAETRNGPLFDLRAEAGGVIGAGVYFYALPTRKEPYRIALKWDLSGMPAGSRGIWSLGEGAQETVGPADMLAFSFYAAGPVKSLPADGKGDYGFYWLSQPPFDPEALAGKTEKLYRYMSRFFEDEGAPYRIFMRANPYPAGGGTALAKSFMFGYGSDGNTIAEGPDMLLAHEMAHNWPKLNGEEDHAETSWYTEGTAEYYAAILALRAGIIDHDKFLSVINAHALSYYGNPYRDLSNKAAGEKYWSDARAQKIPYGRGFLYLIQIDTQMRAASGGKRSLDDLVLEVLRRQRAGEKIGNAQWVEMVVRELGPDAKPAFEAMVAGQPLVMPKASFAPCYQAVPAVTKAFELGFDEMRLGVVKNLRPDTAAAKAGVKEDDTILSMTALKLLRADPSLPMVLHVRRNGQEQTITYLPRGEEAPAYRWERVAGTKDAACKL